MKKRIYLCPMNGTQSKALEEAISAEIREVLKHEILKDYVSIRKFCDLFSLPKSTVSAFLSGTNSKFDIFLKLLIALDIGFEFKR